MQKFILLSLVAGALAWASCTSNTRSQNGNNDTLSDNFVSEHTSQNALDWEGTYEGILPCADCPGIQTIVTLSYDGDFTYHAEYLERDTQVVDNGTIMWHNNGSVVHLTGKDVDVKFQVGENKLFYLDQEGNRIEGELAENYILKKK